MQTLVLKSRKAKFTVDLECRDESKDVRAGGADDFVCEVGPLQDLERLLEVGEPLLGRGRLTARCTHTHGLPNYSTVKKIFPEPVPASLNPDPRY
jgi:hypothetical protein